LRKLIVLFFALVVCASAFGHAGEVHTYMGTVTAVKADGTFVIQKTTGEDFAVSTSPKTAFLFSDESPARRSDLVAGMRVVVKISTDGRTASTVKMRRK
jgi:hypothetical protein